ncbi:hypothetical protein Leryth_023450 [Lithospermum erythrorhizon]|nr:hypothetical protein Leryth_023450 [Lithospermum erythrorhizon]
MNPIMTTNIGVLSLILLSSTYMMTTFPNASAECSNGRCYSTEVCTNGGCNPDTPYPYGCGYGCHCLNYGDGNKCQAYQHE